MIAAVIEEKGSRQEMEDAHFLDVNFGRRGWAYAGVYDGHGGKSAARYAARKLHVAFLSGLRSGLSPEDSFAYGYHTVSSYLEPRPSGTTAVDVFIKDGTVFTANAGDARAIVVGSQNVRQLTVDHRLDHPEERHRIAKMGGVLDYPYVRRGELGLMPTRTLGDGYFKPVGVIATPSVGQHGIDSTDLMVILASDGLWDFVDNNGVAGLVRTADGPESVLEALRREVLVNKWGTDNLTIIAISLGDHEKAERPSHSLPARLVRRVRSALPFIPPPLA